MDSAIAGPSTELLGILAGISGGAFLASTDAALTAFGRPRLRAAAEAEGGGSSARTAARYLERGSTIHKRLLTGRVVCQAVTVLLAYDVARSGHSFVAGVLGVAFAALLYALAVAASSHYAARRASRLALPLLYWVRPLELVMTPLAAPLVWTSGLLERMVPPNPEDTPERVTEFDVDKIIEQGMKLGSIKRDRARLLRSVIEFHGTIAREIMVPRTSIAAIDVDAPLAEVMKLIVEQGHSRYPVYRGTIDQPIGVLYAKDLFQRIGQGGEPTGSLADLVRTPPFFAAESQKISELLAQMQARRKHLAIVADEYGGTSGMVTLEDIIEEIVGEIRDEYDLEEMPIQKLGPGRFMVRADMSAHDVAETTGLRLPPDAGSYDSLGGLIIGSVGRVPAKGESIIVGGYEVTVREADERRIIRVELAERKRVVPAAE